MLLPRVMAVCGKDYPNSLKRFSHVILKPIIVPRYGTIETNSKFK
jgi:hypothetical protein